MWIPAMAPVMWGLMQFVVSADHLHDWHYSHDCAPPTPADLAYAAIGYWTATLAPLAVGLGTAIVAFFREHRAKWPVVETAIIAFTWLALVTGDVTHAIYRTNWIGAILGLIIIWACLPIGGAVVMSCLNTGACVRGHKWGRLALSAVVICGGILYLMWLNAFIIYIDT